MLRSGSEHEESGNTLVLLLEVWRAFTISGFTVAVIEHGQRPLVYLLEDGDIGVMVGKGAHSKAPGSEKTNIVQYVPHTCLCYRHWLFNSNPTNPNPAPHF